MFGNSSLDRVRQIFADQFTSDAHGFVYRRSQRGAQFRVTETERNNFIAAFSRHIRYSTWAIVLGTIILILLLAWFIPESDSTEANVAIWIGVGAIFAAFMAFYLWAWNAPARELQGRMPESAALTEGEARELAFSTITYRKLGLAAAMGVGLVWKQSLETDVLHGWGTIWLIMGGGLVLLSAVQTFRKWRFSQQQADDQYRGR